ncbi:MAG: three-Cys-motif partner protein TcmP [bacterium]|nr:three-Cys-motif partner protein TcmP [bacterium]
MASNSTFHANDFDDGTKIKLAVLKQDFVGWLGNWCQAEYISQINVFDFFAGSGQDGSGEDGSPLVFIKVLEYFKPRFVNGGIQVVLYLNDIDKRKIEALESLMSKREYDFFKTIISNEPFQDCFERLKPVLEGDSTANFVFMDQFGIKDVSISVLEYFSGLARTDILFFISSSFAKRFADSPEFSKYHDISRREFIGFDHNETHRAVLNYFRSVIPTNRPYYLAPFSLKKPKSSNIYGLIHGSGHLRGLEVFLKAAWDIDTTTGEANFPIDGDEDFQDQLPLLDSFSKPTKVDRFEKKLKELILSKELQTNRDVYEFTLKSGLLPTKHARPKFEDMKKNGDIPKQRVGFGTKAIKNNTRIILNHE